MANEGAIIHPSAKVAVSAKIMPGAMIGENVEIGERVTIYPNVIVAHRSKIGNSSIIYTGSQVGQDCTIGKKVELMGSRIPGNVTIDDYAVLSDCGVHQFCHIGEGTFIGGGTVIRKDVAPYLAVVMHKGVVKPYALNKIGAIRKANLTEKQLSDFKEAYALLFSSGLNIGEGVTNLKRINKEYKSSEVEKLITFIENSKRGIYIKKKVLPRAEGRSVLKWLEMPKLYREYNMYETQK